jgi:excisionase family DNA binding protein
MADQGLTIAQAAEVLGVSAKTVRRHIKDGKIAAVRVPGKYGEEYRIAELPRELTGDGGPETTGGSQSGSTAVGGASTQERVAPVEAAAGQEQSPSVDSTSTQQAGRPLDSSRIVDSTAVVTTRAMAMDIIADLQKTNLQLAGQLGAAQERIRELESKVRVLAAARESWWRRAWRSVRGG